MTIQPRPSKVWRLWLILPLSPWRARTHAWWLLVILPCVRCWSAANQRRSRFCSCARRAAVIPVPVSAVAVCKRGARNVEGRQRLLLDHRERPGELPLMAALQDQHPSELCAHHAGGRPLRRLLVPPHQGGAGGVNRRPPRPFHPTPDQQRQYYHEAQGLDAVRFLQAQALDKHWIVEEPGVLLRPVLVLVHVEDVSSVMGQGTRRGPSGAQHEAARLFLHAGHALCLHVDGGRQPLPPGFDSTRLAGARPAPALQRPFLTSDLHQMGRWGQSAELRRRRFRIGAAAILLLLCGPCGGLNQTIRRLDLAFQPLLPPSLLRAGVDDHRPRGRSVERALACIGFLARARTVLRWLRGGEDAESIPRVVGPGLGDDPPACVLGGR